MNGIVEPKRNLPKHLISPLDPEDCIHAARVCDQCDNGSEYWQYWWDQSDEKKFLEEKKKEVQAP